MTLKQAQEYVRAYQEALAEDATLGGRRNPSALPTTRENIMAALRLELARFYYVGEATDEAIQVTVRAAMALDSFTHTAVDAVEFIQSMQRRRKEMEEFYLELLNIGPVDRFYWQRVYALVGISCETKSSTFFQSIKDKLGLRHRDTAHVSPR